MTVLTEQDAMTAVPVDEVSTTDEAADLRVDRCLQCTRLVEPDSRRCSHCDYRPRHHRPWAYLWGFLGTMLTVSVIAVPVGLPLLLKAYHHRVYAEGTVVEPGSTHPRDWIRSRRNKVFYR